MLATIVIVLENIMACRVFRNVMQNSQTEVRTTRNELFTTHVTNQQVTDTSYLSHHPVWTQTKSHSNSTLQNSTLSTTDIKSGIAGLGE